MHEMTDYVAKVYFEATADEFEALEAKIVDTVTGALGCTDEPDHVCPHFRIGFSGPRGGRRRWAIRCALLDLWAAVRHGEVA